MIKLLDAMGSDATVANVARVSLGRRVESVGPDEERLIRYLLRHEHTSPLRHCFAQFHIVAPLFVLRQWGKHQVGCSWNEISYRYVEHDAERAPIWEPEEWREGSASIKQGSRGPLSEKPAEYATELYRETVLKAEEAYHRLLSLGVAREQARAVLPQAVQAEVIWTASLQALLHFLDLRLAPTAQAEIREYAQIIETTIAGLWPVTLREWRALRES